MSKQFSVNAFFSYPPPPLFPVISPLKTPYELYQPRAYKRDFTVLVVGYETSSFIQGSFITENKTMKIKTRDREIKRHSFCDFVTKFYS